MSHQPGEYTPLQPPFWNTARDSAESRTFEYLNMSEEEVGAADYVIGEVLRSQPVRDLLELGESDTLNLPDQSYQVAQVAVTVTRRLQLDAFDQEVVAYASLLHDLGKSAEGTHADVQPDQALPESDRAAVIAASSMNKHPRVAAELIMASDIDPGVKEAVAAIVHAHHTHQVYPYGVEALGYIYWSEIVSIADKIVALASKRPYKDIFTREAVLQTLTDEHRGFYTDTLMAVCFTDFRVPVHATA